MFFNNQQYKRFIIHWNVFMIAWERLTLRLVLSAKTKLSYCKSEVLNKWPQKSTKCKHKHTQNL